MVGARAGSQSIARDFSSDTPRLVSLFFVRHFILSLSSLKNFLVSHIPIIVLYNIILLCDKTLHFDSRKSSLVLSSKVPFSGDLLPGYQYTYYGIPAFVRKK